ncbi:MAG TPA: hypothetical protein VG126_15120 [Thermoleophilaceae bacterium]|nr:hypothetical protein [Thermoleophilaceae bacterium]
MSRRLAVSSLLVVLAAVAPAFPAGAAAEPRVTANPNPVAFGKTLVVKGRGWPVIEFCSRTVRLSLRSDQNAFRIGTDRVGPRGRFRFTWVPRRDEVGRGDWRLVARMHCESGQDGSPNPIRATAPIRIGASNIVVGRGRTSKARWTLYSRRGRFGGFCTGLRTRALRGKRPGGSGEGCGGGLGGEALSLGFFYARHRGSFAHGMAALPVVRVEVTFGAGQPREARLLPSPPVLGFRGRFWIAPFPGQCMVSAAEAFDAEGNVLSRIEIPPAPPPKPGQPSPQPNEDCPA